MNGDGNQTFGSKPCLFTGSCGALVFFLCGRRHCKVAFIDGMNWDEKVQASLDL